MLYPPVSAMAKTFDTSTVDVTPSENEASVVTPSGKSDDGLEDSTRNTLSSPPQADGNAVQEMNSEDTAGVLVKINAGLETNVQARCLYVSELLLQLSI